MNDSLVDLMIANVQRDDAELQKGRRTREWSDEENRFYLEHLRDMSIEEIGEALGRSTNAVKIHRFRAGLPSHRRTPGFLTAHQVALLLGVDSHNPPLWIDHGIMPGERVPMAVMVIRHISWVKFKMWLVRPTSWFYFKAERIKNESLRRLVMLAKERWGDEWWSMVDAAEYHQCTSKDILRYVYAGVLPAVQAPLVGGRNVNQEWAYWFARKSDVLKLKVFRGKGSNRTFIDWPARADAFILRARAEGKTYQEIARMMKWKQKRVEYRARILKLQGVSVNLQSVSTETATAVAI